MLPPNLRKEIRTVAVPWAVTVLWLTVWYAAHSVSATHWIYPTLGRDGYAFLDMVSSLAVPALLHLISAALFAGEFAWGTMPQLLASPVSRAVLWRDKITVQLASLGSVLLIPLFAWMNGVELPAFQQVTGLGEGTLAIIAPLFLTSACVVPWLVLAQRTYVAPVLIGVGAAPCLLISMAVFIAFLDEKWFPATNLKEELNQAGWIWRIYWILLLGLCALTFWAGRRSFLNLEVAPTASRSSRIGKRLAGILFRSSAPETEGTKKSPGFKPPRALMPLWKEWRQLRTFGSMGLGLVVLWLPVQAATLLLINTRPDTKIPFALALFLFLSCLYVTVSSLTAHGFVSEYEDNTLSFLLVQPSRRHYHFLRKLAASGAWITLLWSLAWAGGRLLVALQRDYPLFQESARRLPLAADEVDMIAVLGAVLGLFLLCTAPLLSLWVRGRAVIFLVPFAPVVALTVWFVAEDLFDVTKRLPEYFELGDDFNTLPFIVLMLGALLTAWRRFCRAI